jgi:hypothetical protein
MPMKIEAGNPGRAGKHFIGTFSRFFSPELTAQL